MSRRKVADRRVLGPKIPYQLPDNPKDLVAQTKLDLSLIPETLIVEVGLAFYEGALKYGRYNWRMRPVKASVYLSAADRHILKYKAGEERDPLTGTLHLAYTICCVAIIIDADKYGTLVDDRAPRGRLNPNIAKQMDTEVMKRIKHLKNLFKDEKPKQFTIGDSIDDDVILGSATAPRGKPRKAVSRKKK